MFKALLFSPLVGFVCAAGLLLLMKLLVRRRDLCTAPEGERPPPAWIRVLLILTCTGVSFAHGGNDGQKGMGLIMLILIGAAPTAYALNRAIPEDTTPIFLHVTQDAQAVFAAHGGGEAPVDPAAARREVGDALKSKDVNSPAPYAALASLTGDIAGQVQDYGAIKAVPAAATPNVRNDMYLASDAVRVMMGTKPADFSEEDLGKLKSLRSSLENGTRFIPTWVKVTVALALGLGTMSAGSGSS